MDSNHRFRERGTFPSEGLFEIAPFDHSGNSVPATEMIWARLEAGPIWGVRRCGNKSPGDMCSGSHMFRDRQA